MDPILQQIINLLETAPLSNTGKADIRHTIRTEYYAQPEIHTIDIPTKPLRYVSSTIEDPNCYCPIDHKHTQREGTIICGTCDCNYGIHIKIQSRIQL